MRLWDISQPVDQGIAVWPGDEAFQLGWTMHHDEGASVNVARLTLSAHTGTHADGPLHVLSDGAPIGAEPLERYVGSAHVVDATGHEELDVDVLARAPEHGLERLLLRTREHVDPREFPARFAALTPGLARELGRRGVRLVGTDAPSVDPAESKTLDAHRELMSAGVAILENLWLSDVPEGEYTLIALPLRLLGADSSPVRAVLLREKA